MSSINLKPLGPNNDAHSYLNQVVLLPTKLQRVQALSALKLTNIEAILDTIEALLASPNITQREPTLDLALRISELQRRDLLKSRLSSLLQDSCFPLKNIVWLLCRLEFKIPEDTTLRLYTHSDRETVLPYLFHLYTKGKWTILVHNIYVPHPDIHIRLWTQYFSKRSQIKTREKIQNSELLELHRLNDSSVKEWMTEELGKARYDEDILSVLIESPEPTLFEPLWRAVWKHPKHQALALKALDALLPFDDTSTEVLFRRARAASNRINRRYFADKLAQRASKVVYHQVRSLCRSLDQEARLLGVEILGVFGSPWHSARPACTQLLLERLNDPSLKVRRAAVEGLQRSERIRIQRHCTEALTPHDLTQLNRAWESLANTCPSPRKPHFWGKQNRITPVKKPSNLSAKSQTLSSLAPALSHTPAPVLTRGSALRALRRPFLTHIIQRTPPIALFLGLIMSTLGFSMQIDTSDRFTQRVREDLQAKEERNKISETTTLSLRLPQADILLSRSDTWYLYHRHSPETAADYVGKGPTPNNTLDSRWNLYSTWLIPIICTDIIKGKHHRAAQFFKELVSRNPRLANLMLPSVMTRLPASHRDDIAVSLLRGGLSATSLELHSSVTKLNLETRILLETALNSGWKTRNEKTLLAKLKALKDFP